MITVKAYGIRARFRIALLLSVAGACPLVSAIAANPGADALNQPSQAEKGKILESYGKLPLSFEVNRGQADSDVRFLSRGPGYSLSFTANKALLSLSKPAQTPAGRAKQPSVRDQIGLELLGANATPAVAGEDELPGKVNYLVGSDRSKWSRNVPTYGKVRYAGVYPGVDLVYYGNQKQLEYDFVVAPGAATQQIRLHFSGARHVTLDRDGSLTVHARDGAIAFRQPAIYQEIDGQRRAVKGRFTLLANNTAGFQVGVYDHSRPLVIDPVLAYSTFYGFGEYWLLTQTMGVAVDASGCAYVTAEGYEVSSVTKFDFFGSTIVYATNLGLGAGYYGPNIIASGIAVDAQGHAFVTGNDGIGGLATTPGAYQTTPASIYVSELSLDGSDFLYSTFLGPSTSSPGAIALDTLGNIYVTGSVGSSGFPVTPGAYPATSNSGAFVAKINPAGHGSSDLVYSTYLSGATSSGIAPDSEGNILITGTAGPNLPTTPGAFQTTYPNAYPEDSYEATAFIAKFKPAGQGQSDLVYSTYLGGSSGEVSAGIAVDSAGNAYIAGTTLSDNFPVTPGAFQTVLKSADSGFISKLSPKGQGASDLLYSTYLGGSVGDGVSGIALDPSGNVLVAGITESPDFPVTHNATQPFLASVGSAAFLTQLNPAGNGSADLLFSTYLGGSSGTYSGGTDYTPYTAAYGIAVDTSGNAYVVGMSSDFSFPTTAGVYEPTLLSGGIYDGGPGSYADGILSKFRFHYDPPPVASLQIVSGNNQTGQFGIPFENPLVVLAKDSNGNPIPAIPVSFSGTNVALNTPGTIADSAGDAIVIATPNAPCAGTVTASVNGSVPPVTFNFSSVGPEQLDITARAVTTTYGVSFSPIVSVVGGDTFHQPYTLQVQDAATVPSPPPDPLHAGAQSYSVVAQSANASCGAPYFTGTSNTAALTIQQASIRLYAQDAKMFYGGTLPSFTYSTINPPINSTALPPGPLSGTPEFSTTATSSSPIGVYPLTISQGSLQVTGITSIDYQFAPEPATVHVEPAPLTVTPVSISISAGTPIPPLTYNITGFVNGDPSTVVTGTPGVWTLAGPTPAPGTYTIYSNRGSLEAANYGFVYATGTLTVTQ